MLTAHNVVLAISQSGATDEILNLLPYVKRLAIPLIVMTGNPESALAAQADVALDTGVEQEVCPLNLAPTLRRRRNCAGRRLGRGADETPGIHAEDFASASSAGHARAAFADSGPRPDEHGRRHTDGAARGAVARRP